MSSTLYFILLDINYYDNIKSSIHILKRKVTFAVS
jgi:hypothetical protein